MVPTRSETLASDHQRRQLAFVSALMRELPRLLPLINTRKLNPSLQEWMSAVIALARDYARGSGALAADYYELARQEAGMGDDFRPTVPVDPVDEDAAKSSLQWATRGLWDEKVDRVDAAVQRTVQRITSKMVLDSGRSVIHDAVREDPLASGYARTASLAACGFCKMLACRGPVYGADTVGFRAHDGCSCGQLVVFKGQDYIPSPRVQIWSAKYEALQQQGLRGAELRTAFDNEVRPHRER